MLHKKQLFSITEDICRLNADIRNGQPYTDVVDSTVQIREALEGFNVERLFYLLESQDASYQDQIPTDSTTNAIARAIVANSDQLEPISDMKRFDKALNAMYSAISSMSSLGLSAENIVEGLQLKHDTIKQNAANSEDVIKSILLKRTV